MAQHPASQQPAFVQHFAHPGRGNPWHPFNSRQHALHDAANNCCRLGAGLHRIPHRCDKGGEPLFDYAIQQLFAVFEVVVHHRWRQARAFRDQRKARRSHSLRCEKVGSSAQQQIAGVVIKSAGWAAGLRFDRVRRGIVIIK